MNECEMSAFRVWCAFFIVAIKVFMASLVLVNKNFKAQVIGY